MGPCSKSNDFVSFIYFLRFSLFDKIICINLAFYKLLARISRMPRMLYFSPAEGSQGKNHTARRGPEGKRLATLPIPFLT
jgi:hypothetical protein